MKKSGRVKLHMPSGAAKELNAGAASAASEGGRQNRSWKDTTLSDWTVTLHDKQYSIHRSLLGRGPRKSGFFLQEFTTKSSDGKMMMTQDVSAQASAANAAATVSPVAAAAGDEGKAGMNATLLTAHFPDPDFVPAWEAALDFCYDDYFVPEVKTSVRFLVMATFLKIDTLVTRVRSFIKASLNATTCLDYLRQAVELKQPFVLAESLPIVAEAFSLFKPEQFTVLPLSTLLEVLSAVVETGSAKSRTGVSNVVTVYSRHHQAQLVSTQFHKLVGHVDEIDCQDVLFLLARSLSLDDSKENVFRSRCMQTAAVQFGQVDLDDIGLLPYETMLELIRRDTLWVKSEDLVVHAVGTFIAAKRAPAAGGDEKGDGAAAGGGGKGAGGAASPGSAVDKKKKHGLSPKKKHHSIEDGGGALTETQVRDLYGRVRFMFVSLPLLERIACSSSAATPHRDLAQGLLAKRLLEVKGQDAVDSFAASVGESWRFQRRVLDIAVRLADWNFYRQEAYVTRSFEHGEREWALEARRQDNGGIGIYVFVSRGSLPVTASCRVSVRDLRTGQEALQKSFAYTWTAAGGCGFPNFTSVEHLNKLGCWKAGAASVPAAAAAAAAEASGEGSGGGGAVGEALRLGKGRKLLQQLSELSIRFDLALEASSSPSSPSSSSSTHAGSPMSERKKHSSASHGPELQSASVWSRAYKGSRQRATAEPGSSMLGQVVIPAPSAAHHSPAPSSSRNRPRPHHQFAGTGVPLHSLLNQQQHQQKQHLHHHHQQQQQQQQQQQPRHVQMHQQQALSPQSQHQHHGEDDDALADSSPPRRRQHFHSEIDRSGDRTPVPPQPASGSAAGVHHGDEPGQGSFYYYRNGSAAPLRSLAPGAAAVSGRGGASYAPVYIPANGEEQAQSALRQIPLVRAPPPPQPRQQQQQQQQRRQQQQDNGHGHWHRDGMHGSPAASPVLEHVDGPPLDAADEMRSFAIPVSSSAGSGRRTFIHHVSAANAPPPVEYVEVSGPQGVYSSQPQERPGQQQVGEAYRQQPQPKSFPW